uniref:Uncharacterized protein n=1 Tax=Arundo donax TaxID=35708 RepID=A0A0A9AKU2_ARUDO
MLLRPGRPTLIDKTLLLCCCIPCRIPLYLMQVLIN